MAGLGSDFRKVNRLLIIVIILMFVNEFSVKVKLLEEYSRYSLKGLGVYGKLYIYLTVCLFRYKRGFSSYLFTVYRNRP